MKNTLLFKQLILLIAFYNSHVVTAQKKLEDLDKLLVSQNIQKAKKITTRGGGYPGSFSIKSFAPTSIVYNNNGLNQSNFSVVSVYQGFTMAKRLAEGSKNIPPFDYREVISKQNASHRFNEGFGCEERKQDHHIMRSFGILEQFGANYMSNNSSCMVDPTENSVNKLKSYSTLSFVNYSDNRTDYDNTLFDIKKALNERSAVVVVMNIIDVCHWYKYISEYMCFIGCDYNANEPYKPVIEDKSVFQANQSANDTKGFKHAFTVVSYDDFKLGGALELQNSWGTDFGDQGFIWIKYSDIFKESSGAMFYKLEAE